MEPGDEIDIYYEGSKYRYTVTDKKIISSTDIDYLSSNLNTNQLTLMTCWPPGTTLKRLVIWQKVSPCSNYYKVLLFTSQLLLI